MKWHLPSAAILFLLCCPLVSAHSMHQSALLLDFRAHAVEVELQLPASRFEQAAGSGLMSHLQAAETWGYVMRRVHVRSTGLEWSKELTEPLKMEWIEGAPFVVAHMRFIPPPGRSPRQFILEDDVVTDAVPSQSVLVSVRSDWNNGAFGDDPTLLGVLSSSERSMPVEREEGAWLNGFSSIVHLGVRHIAEGTDHLLFLMALLLPASLLAVDGRWRGFAGVRFAAARILKVVTAFTIGHSVTLALAASGVVHVPGRPIEILIAVSILVSAVHALRPIFPGGEAVVAGSFGLIHGLAFASTLADMGLHRWERVEGILAFNLGIEAMQLVVVFCVMPSLMLLSQTIVYRPFRVFGGLFAAISACGWIVERATNRNLGIDRAINLLAVHPIPLAVALLAVSLLALYVAPTAKWIRPEQEIANSSDIDFSPVNQTSKPLSSAAFKNGPLES